MVAQHLAGDWQRHPATPPTWEEALYDAVGPSQLSGTDPECGPQLRRHLRSGRTDRMVFSVHLSTPPPHTIVRAGRLQTCRSSLVLRCAVGG